MCAYFLLQPAGAALPPRLRLIKKQSRGKSMSDHVEFGVGRFGSVTVFEPSLELGLLDTKVHLKTKKNIKLKLYNKKYLI